MGADDVPKDFKEFHSFPLERLFPIYLILFLSIKKDYSIGCVLVNGINLSQYDVFAADFARTRARPWDFLVAFMQELTDLDLLKQHEIGIDLGCGNGQNASLLSKNALVSVGIDTSWKLLRMGKNKYSHLIHADLQMIPLRGETFDFGACVAVLHHVIGRETRQQAVAEIKRILKPGGNLILTVWRRWQRRFWKFFLHEGFYNASLYFPAGKKNFGDIDVGWRDSTSHALHSRLYHLFTRAEMRTILTTFQILLFKLTGHKNSRTNYIVFLQK